MSEIGGEEKGKKNEKNDEYKENDEEEEEDDDEEEEEEEEEETEEEKKLKSILQKYEIEYDEEEIPTIISDMLNERDLPPEDYNFLYDLYIKSLIKY